MSDVGRISDFRTLLSTLSLDALTRGKQFERVTKWWLENDPIHSRQIEKVWLWDEWPEYPGQDIGIDLVARLLDGSLMAVQAKCVDESRSIPKSELDSFVSAASSNTFKNKMLVATTDGLSANAQRMLADQHVIRVMLSDLENSVDVWPSSIDHLDQHPVQPKAIPRPHQQQAISDIATGMSDHDRGQLIMACGTGKTLTALWITEQLKPTVTLVLVPSLNLLSQTLSEWSKNTTSDWSYLCVCSDDTVNKSDDQPISTVDELPFEVTTNPDEIATFLTHSGTRIIFSTYQSSARVAQAQQLTGTMLNLVICDEAHRLTGKTDADYSTVLDNSKIVAEKRLFMTATPRTYTTAAKSKAEDRGVEITSMDDETVYGPVLHKLSFGEAIKQDLLSDYRVLIVGVTDPQVQDLIDRRELVSVNDTVTTDARTLAAHIGLAKATKDYNLKRTISFHSRIKSADQFAQDHIKILDWLPDTHKPEGTTWTGTISGAMNTGERRRLLTQLKQDDQDRHALLTNARCLTEGVDVPSLDGVAFIDPRSSQVDIIQAVGRAIRKSANKEIGTIVLPVLIPTDADAEHALEDTAFKPIWAILNALKSHDEELAVELNTLRTELGRTGKVGQLPDCLVEDLPSDIDLLLPEFSHKLSVEILERSTASWESMFGQLQNYVDEHGHASPPALKVGRGRLAQWVGDQRSLNNSGLLDDRRVLQLESLPGWTWDPLGDSWNSFYSLLLEFSIEFGHAAVPSQPQTYRGQRLAGWLNTQRTKYNKGLLDQKVIEKLEGVQGWTWAPKDDQFERGFQALKQFAAREGTSRVSSGHVELLNNEKINLASWTTTRRGDYKRGWLTKEQIEAFETLPGWSWTPKEDDWTSWFNLLSQFSEEFGHALVPQGRSPKRTLYKGRDLSGWVNTQRSRYNAGKLELYRIEQLQSVKGWLWRPYDDAWDSKYVEVRESSKEHGSLDVFLNNLGSRKDLKAWIDKQKFEYRKKQLSRDRENQLLEIPGWTWETRDLQQESWNLWWDTLNKYVVQFGTASPPRSYVVNGLKLGEWVKTRRAEYKSGLLSKERQELLEQLSGWTWDPFDGAWHSMFRDLLLEVERNKGFLPEEFADERLSTWVVRQRQLKSKDNLAKERFDLLDQIRGWHWNYGNVLRTNWEEKFQTLCEFVELEGHARVRDKSLFQGVKLGTWVSVQRRRHLDGVMPEEQRKLLEALPRWSWNPVEDDWKATFQELTHFIEIHGRLATNRMDPKESELAQWIGVQRSAYKDKKIPLHRKELLEETPGWQWSIRNENTKSALWDKSFIATKNYSEREGNLRMSKSFREEGIAIAPWIAIQRKTYKDGKLSAEKIQMLESLEGWAWDVFDEAWELRYEMVLQFVHREHHGQVPQRHIEKGIDIGTWVNSQRTNYAQGNLGPERIERLEQIPNWVWRPKEDAWKRNFELLRDFVDLNGHARVPNQFCFEQVQLGKWVGKQRQKFKKGQLSQDRISLLEAFPGWLWSVREK